MSKTDHPPIAESSPAPADLPPGPPAESTPSPPAAPPPGGEAEKPKAPKKRGRKKTVKTPAEVEMMRERRRERDRLRKRKKAAEARQADPPIGPSPSFRAPPPPPPPEATPPPFTVEDGPSTDEAEPEFAVNLGAMMDPSFLAETGVVMLDAGVVMLAGRVLENAEMLSIRGTPKQEVLEKAAKDYLATLDINMSPGQVLIATAVAMYLPAALMMYGAQKMGG